MTNLLECVVKSIDLRKSHYYDGQGVSYNDAIDNSRKFIEEYFYKGGKFSFLLNTITDNNDYDEGRCNHVVNTYYTGLYLLGKIDGIWLRGSGSRIKTTYLYSYLVRMQIPSLQCCAYRWSSALFSYWSLSFL